MPDPQNRQGGRGDDEPLVEVEVDPSVVGQDDADHVGMSHDGDGLLRVRDPQLLEHKLWTEVEHPELGTALVERWRFRLSKVSPTPPQRAPLLGEHNDVVFQEIVGMTEDEVNDLLVEGVLR